MISKRTCFKFHLSPRFLICAALILIIDSEFREASAKNSISNKQKAPSTHHETLDPALAAMRTKYEGVQTLTAQFVQSQKNAALGRTKESKGRIYIKRPNMFRWETFEPDASILVGNGRKIWFYTPPFRNGEKGQVMIRAAQDAQSKLAVDLMVGGGDFRKNFDYRRINPLHYRLNPLKAAGDIDHIELFLENQTNLVYKIQLVSNSGNETIITLSKVELGPKLDTSMFNFEVPSNTEVVQ